jgi:tyrosyl-tRNA synthetase
MIKADVELGGTDQLFNIMVGRDLQRDEGLPQQVAMVMPILEGLDGKQKMSKSLENYVALNESPAEMFGKLMSIGDDLMPRYFKVLLRENVPNGEHPMESKKSLARRVTERFHSVEEADSALKDFELRFSRRDLEHADLPLFSPEGQARDVVSVVVEAYARCFGIVKSRSEARRLIEAGSVQWSGSKIVDPKASLSHASGVLKLDKTRAVRISVEAPRG